MRLIRGETRGVPASAARGALGLAALGYRSAVAARNKAFDLGLLKTSRAGVPVVSVGNLTLGGTGKTPTVEWVARWFRAREVRVTVLSRGYRRDGAVNDEAMVLETNLPDVPHLQDPDRVRMAAVAVEELGAEVLVLDDGFQHRRIGRDLDLVLLDALDPFGAGRVFPRGLLREPASALRRADLVVVSRVDFIPGETLDALRREAERAAGPLRWVLTRHAPIEVVGEGVEPDSPDGLAGRRVAAFCGIGNPEGFRKTLGPLVSDLRAFRAFPDHHGYTATDVADLTRWAREAGADLVLTTQKDSVKLRTGSLGAVPLRALRIGLEVIEGESLLDDALARLLPAADRTE